MNITKTVDDTVLQVNGTRDCTNFKWYYTSNGAVAPYTKVIAISFKDGLLNSFIDNWDLYNVSTNIVNLSKQEAIAIALEVARNHTWSMKLDKDTLSPENLNAKRSVSWAVLNFENSVNATNTRGNDALSLYPVWRIGLSLNKAYGILFGIEVDIWADNKEVRDVSEQYSDFMAQILNNVTRSNGLTTSTPCNQSTITDNNQPVNPSKDVQEKLAWGFSTEISLLAIIATLAVSSFILKYRKSDAAISLRLPRRSLKLRILLCILLLLVISMPMVETASADRAGVIWGATSTGAYNNPHHSWRKTDAEVTYQGQVATFIATNCFTTANGYTDFNQEATDKSSIIPVGAYINNTYDNVAVVDFDHGVTGKPWLIPYPEVPENESHYMFEDDWGTDVGPPPPNDSHDYSHGVYDIDIYHMFLPSKVNFAFINTCMSANLWELGQGFTPAGNPLGMPFAFTHRIVAGAPTGKQMSADGYNYPDSFPQCYIGFRSGSAALEQGVDYNGQWNQAPFWWTWVENFFNMSFNQDISIKDALDMASWYAWQCQSFNYSPLTGDGFTAVWPEDVNGDGTYEVEGHKGYNCIMEVYGNSNLHLHNLQISDYVTPPSIDGPTYGDANTNYQFSASSLDSEGHNIWYRFYWGDGSYSNTYPVANGETRIATHSWSADGTYSVTVQACCQNGVWSTYAGPIYVSIGAYHWLTVYACDAYTHVPCYPEVRIDDQPVGRAPVSVYIPRGDYSVSVDYMTYDSFWGSDVPVICFLGDSLYWYSYDTASVGVYSDTSVTAIYWQT